jgi:hypothetical protein
MSFNPEKTEIMICSNMEIPNNLDMSFNGKLISNTSSHKHLGVTLSHDAKWSEHRGVNNIAKTISKHLGVLRKFKCKMNRQNLEKLHLFIFVPSLNTRVKFGTTVRGTCHSNKSEKLQLEAARIRTGLPIFTKTDSLCFVSGWELLHNRRHRRKLQLFYKIYIVQRSCTAISA